MMMIDLLDVTVAKSILVTLQERETAKGFFFDNLTISEGEWVDRMARLHIDNISDVIEYLVQRGEVIAVKNSSYPDVVTYRVV